jgi:hypothetical protein
MVATPGPPQSLKAGRGNSCPSCGAHFLRRSHDMWGPFRVCDHCGYAMDDERSLPAGVRVEGHITTSRQ